MNRRWLIIIPAGLIAASLILCGIKIAGATFTWWAVFAPILCGAGIMVAWLFSADFDDHD